MALVLTVNLGVKLHLTNGNKHGFICVWLCHAFVRSDFVEVSCGIGTYLRMLFTRVLMLFVVKRQLDVVHMAELRERYLMKVYWLADSVKGTCKCCCILGVALNLQKGDYVSGC
jgi:hypothetical protein